MSTPVIVRPGPFESLQCGFVEILLGQFAEPAYARVVAGRFDLVRYIERQGEQAHPRTPYSVDPHGIQNFFICEAQFSLCQRGGHGSVQEFWILSFGIPHRQTPILRKA